MKARRFLAAILCSSILGFGAAQAQVTAPGTDYPTFWSGELRILAQRPDTQVTVIDLDDGSLFDLPGTGAVDLRLVADNCYIVSASGVVTESPTNPFVLPDRGSMFRCTGGLGGPRDEIRVRVLSEDATAAGDLKPVTIWTGSPVTAAENSWGSFVPSDFESGQTFGREIGVSFVGTAQSESIFIAPVQAGVTTTIEVTRLDSNTGDSLVLNEMFPTCPAPAPIVPPIDPGATPCYLYDGPEVQVVYDGGYADDRIIVSSNVAISVLTGHRLSAFVADNATVTHENGDWTATPPSWKDGDEGQELGTQFYTFARQAITIFPTEHDTTIQIVDLSDGDDTREVFLEHGDIFDPKVPDFPQLSIFTPFLDARVGGDISPRPAEPAVELVTAGENPFDNDVVKITSDKPILVYQGPAGSDVNEFADVAFSVPVGPQERLLYTFAQNFGSSNDFQLFSYPGASQVTIVSLSFTEGFRGFNPEPGHHDFLVDFFEVAPPAVTPWPLHDTFVTYGVPGSIQFFGSGKWSGELLVVRSQRPLTVISGDYDTPHFGAYVPFVPTSRELPPVARLATDATATCLGSSFALSGANSFDQDPEGDDPQIVSYEWDFGDGSSLVSSGPDVSHTYVEPGTYTVTLTVLDNEGAADSDTIEVTVLPSSADECEACGPCDGKVSELTLRYDGDLESAQIQVVQRVKGRTRGEVFSGTISAGEEFTFFGRDKKATLGPEIEVWIDGALHVEIHTSCSQPIGPGMRFGDVTVVSGRSRNGGLLCPDCEMPAGGDEDSGKKKDFGRRGRR